MANSRTHTSQPSRSAASPLSTFDVIVVGAGGVGTATAYHLARLGRRVLLLEQFQLGHTQGSSHGGSRIIRYTHDTTAYAQQMPATFQLWAQLEAESGTQLLQPAGGLYMGPEDDRFLQGSLRTLDELNFPYQTFTGAELVHHYPNFRIPGHWIAFFQEQTAILAATRCVQSMAQQAMRHGALLREMTQVEAIEPHGEGVIVRALGPGGTTHYSAAQVVVTAGPWAGRMLATLLGFPLPLRVTHQQVAYFAAQKPADYALGRFPIFIVTKDPHFYGFPIYERDGAVKIAVEQTANTVDPDGPREIDRLLQARLSELVAGYFVGLDPQPVHMETCLYTETPSRDFIIDRHPVYPQILFAAGFSGRGFKHTIAIGQLLADLSQSAPGSYTSPFWLDQYRLAHFAPDPQHDTGR
jgi:monomeric sarcosine oxidase